MRRVAPVLLASVYLASLPLACGSSDEPAASGAAGAGGSAGSAGAAPVDPGPYKPPAASLVIEQGAVKIRREIIEIAGTQAPPNPTTGDATPDGQQRVRAVRYRVDADPPRPARAVAVMMPGFLGGAGSFDSVARALVRRSTDDAALEVWAVDRRSNLLEDHHGLDVAEHFRDPGAATRYYFDSEEVEGKTFGGFLPQGKARYMSEWGLATTLGDLRKLIELVPQGERRARVMLVGHSLGATIAEAYASWDFDGTPGFSELSSLVLIDGASGGEGGEIGQSQKEYEEGGAPAPGGFGTSPGVNGIRQGGVYFTLPFLGTKVYPVAAITAMRGALQPAEFTADTDRDGLLKTLLSLKDLPKMTNRAALGLAFDARSNALSFAAVNCGEPGGGPMTEYDSLFGVKLLHPSDAAATYDWVEFSKTTPPEHTSLDDLARSWYEGPGLDFAEWYFPQRLPADAAVAGSLTLKETDWPAAAHGLRAYHGRAMDLPIFGHAAGLMGGDVGNFQKLKELVQETPIGPDRPLAGEARSSEKAFNTLGSPGFSHIDPLLGSDAPGSPVAAWYDALAAWARLHSPPGGVVVTAP